jgi:hypothetical protein
MIIFSNLGTISIKFMSFPRICTHLAYLTSWFSVNSTVFVEGKETLGSMKDKSCGTQCHVIA